MSECQWMSDIVRERKEVVVDMNIVVEMEEVGEGGQVMMTVS